MATLQGVDGQLRDTGVSGLQVANFVLMQTDSSLGIAKILNTMQILRMARLTYAIKRSKVPRQWTARPREGIVSHALLCCVDDWRAD